MLLLIFGLIISYSGQKVTFLSQLVPYTSKQNSILGKWRSPTPWFCTNVCRVFQTHLNFRMLSHSILTKILSITDFSGFWENRSSIDRPIGDFNLLQCFDEHGNFLHVHNCENLLDILDRMTSVFCDGISEKTVYRNCVYCFTLCRIWH